MKTTWKFPLPITDEPELDMPAGAEILSVGVQDESLQLWALVNPQNAPEKRCLRVYGTGHPIDHDEDGLFIGTCILHGGALVLHVFEIADCS